MRKATIVGMFLLLLLAVPVSAGQPRRFVLGDVNRDGLANSTDVLIILNADAGMKGTARFCPMNLGDVNSDHLVNSTDALIILVADVGLPVPYPVGQPVAYWPWLYYQPLGCYAY